MAPPPISDSLICKTEAAAREEAPFGWLNAAAAKLLLKCRSWERKEEKEATRKDSVSPKGRHKQRCQKLVAKLEKMKFHSSLRPLFKQNRSYQD